MEQVALSLKKLSEIIIKSVLGLYIIGAVFTLWWRSSIINIITPNEKMVFGSIFPMIAFFLIKLNRYLVGKKTSLCLITSIIVSVLPFLFIIFSVTAPVSIFVLYDNLIRSFR